MAITRLEMNYYKNIERIAVALEKMVAQTDQTNTARRYDRISAASKLIYGNQSQGRSQENYDYPNRQTQMQATGSTINSFEPTIQSPLDTRIYQESQAVTGGEFQAWYNALTSDERTSYQRVYGH